MQSGVSLPILNGNLTDSPNSHLAFLRALITVLIALSTESSIHYRPIPLDPFLFIGIEAIV
jgi:hypothetical protein